MEQSERGARFPGDGTGVPTVRQVVAARPHRGRLNTPRRCPLNYTHVRLAWPCLAGGAYAYKAGLPPCSDRSRAGQLPPSTRASPPPARAGVVCAHTGQEGLHRYSLMQGTNHSARMRAKSVRRGGQQSVTSYARAHNRTAHKGSAAVCALHQEATACACERGSARQTEVGAAPGVTPSSAQAANGLAKHPRSNKHSARASQQRATTGDVKQAARTGHAVVREARCPPKETCGSRETSPHARVHSTRACQGVCTYLQHSLRRLTGWKVVPAQSAAVISLFSRAAI